jgi:hypothetical protein
MDYHEENDGRRLLSSLRDVTPEEQTVVDVRRAMKSGRRQVRVRQAALPVVGAIVLVAMVISVALAVQRPPTQPAAQSAGFNVLRQAFHIGSAAGFTPQSYETGRYRQRMSLTPANAGAMLGTDAVVTMYARGWFPYYNGIEWTPAGESGDLVENHRTLWLTQPVTRPGAVELAWEYAPGAWGFVSVKGPAASRDRAYKVALSVWAGASDLVTIPATVPKSALGEQDRIVGTISPIGVRKPGPQILEVLYGNADAPQPPDDDAGWIGVGIQHPPTDPAQTEVLNGKPVNVSGTRIMFSGNSGLFVEASSPDMLTQIGGLAKLRGIAAAITPTPDFRWPEQPRPTVTPTDAPSTTPSPSATPK